ncbi:SIR2 family protein [Kitasatospora sp. NPDC008115]|uniref:SIR2 family protein n=1 Tax=Kitasatospora sp. NPDC008115 TaxID=3364022 RepID=UPI0036EBE88B
MTEPHVNLAFGLHSLPGTYSVLLGAGVSTAAGIPAAWHVQRDLILKIAAAEQADVPDGEDAPFDWYRERYGRPAAYDDLLAALTATANERQALLRSYFEPTAQEREAGVKTPSAAHRSLARLVASGHIRVILTVNFDHLMEAALRDIGIEPTVVSGPAALGGMLPLHAQRAVVVHLHGDYLSPATMLNTPDELEAYTRETDALLDRVIDEYGLVVAGWSASWDPALREAITRCPSRRFATYWIDTKPLSPEAAATAAHRGATVVQDSADGFLGRTADAVAAIGESGRQHPLNTAVAVATAKRELAGDRPAIGLHDTLRREASALAALPARVEGPWQVADPKREHQHRLDGIEAASETLLALVATAAYWGNETTDRWWMPEIQRFAEPVGNSGFTSLLNLTSAPALMMLYTAGVAAAAADRWSLVGHLLGELQTQREEETAAVGLLSPDVVLGVPRAAKRLHDHLQPLFVQHLALGPSAYRDAWERFEYLRLLAQARHTLPRGISSDVPYIRAFGRREECLPAPSDWLAQAIERRNSTPIRELMSSGFFDGDVGMLNEARQTYDSIFQQWADDLRLRAMIGRDPAFSGTGPWYPDALQ